MSAAILCPPFSISDVMNKAGMFGKIYEMHHELSLSMLFNGKAQTNTATHRGAPIGSRKYFLCTRMNIFVQPKHAYEHICTTEARV